MISFGGISESQFNKLIFREHNYFSNLKVLFNRFKFSVSHHTYINNKKLINRLINHLNNEKISIKEIETTDKLFDKIIVRVSNKKKPDYKNAYQQAKDNLLRRHNEHQSHLTQQSQILETNSFSGDDKNFAIGGDNNISTGDDENSQTGLDADFSNADEENLVSNTGSDADENSSLENISNESEDASSENLKNPSDIFTKCSLLNQCIPDWDNPDFKSTVLSSLRSASPAEVEAVLENYFRFYMSRSWIPPLLDDPEILELLMRGKSVDEKIDWLSRFSKRLNEYNMQPDWNLVVERALSSIEDKESVAKNFAANWISEGLLKSVEDYFFKIIKNDSKEFDKYFSVISVKKLASEYQPSKLAQLISQNPVRVMHQFKAVQEGFLRSEVGKEYFFEFILSLKKVNPSFYIQTMVKLHPKAYGILFKDNNQKEIAYDLLNYIKHSDKRNWKEVSKYNRFIALAQKYNFPIDDLQALEFDFETDSSDFKRVASIYQTLSQQIISKDMTKEQKHIAKQARYYLDKMLDGFSKGKEVAIPCYYHSTKPFIVNSIIELGKIENRHERLSPGAWFGTKREEGFGNFCFALSQQINKYASEENRASGQNNNAEQVIDVWIGFQQDVDLNLRKFGERRTEDHHAVHISVDSSAVSSWQNRLRERNIKVPVISHEVNDKLVELFANISQINYFRFPPSQPR